MNKDRIIQLLGTAEDLLDALNLDGLDKADIIEVLDEIKDEL